MTLIFREASRCDATSISEIYNQAIETKYSIGDVNPLSVTSHEAWIEEASSSMPFVVGTVSDQIVSWACIRPFSQSPYFEGTVKSSLFVHKAFRRQKLGTRTKQYLIQRSEEAGVNCITSSCFSTNLGSISLNHSLGFREWARLPKIAKIDGEYVDLLTLGLTFQ